MRDNEGCGLLRTHQVIQGLLHEVLVLTVQGTGCLVQEQHLGIPDDGSSNRNSLLLPPRYACRLLAWVCAIGAWQLADKTMCIGQFGSPLDLVGPPASSGAICDVVL